MPLIQITVNGRQAKVHPECEDGFRADRANGLIYGPYIIYNELTHERQFCNTAEEASMAGNFCPYCKKE